MCECALCELKKVVEELTLKVNKPMKGPSACMIKGIVTGLIDNEIVAEVLTADGLAYLDINVGGENLFPEIKIGDVVEADEMGHYITNGRIYACIGNNITVNGQHYNWE